MPHVEIHVRDQRQIVNVLDLQRRQQHRQLLHKLRRQRMHALHSLTHNRQQLCNLVRRVQRLLPRVVANVAEAVHGPLLLVGSCSTRTLVRHRVNVVVAAKQIAGRAAVGIALCAGVNFISLLILCIFVCVCVSFNVQIYKTQTSM